MSAKVMNLPPGKRRSYRSGTFITLYHLKWYYLLSQNVIPLISTSNAPTLAHYHLSL
jgi:hypothetical protein